MTKIDIARLARLGSCLLVAAFFPPPGSVSAQSLSVTVTVTGDTFDNSDAWSITNNSAAGQNVTSCTVDLSTASFPGGVVFGTAGGATGNPADDTDFNTSDTATVGLTSPEADSLEDGDVTDRSSSFTMTFNDFDPGEAFTYGIDVDDTGDDAGIDGADLDGTLITCTVGGTQLSDTLSPTSSSASSATLSRQGVTAPTLSQWGMLMLVLFLGGAGYIALRGKSRQEA